MKKKLADAEKKYEKKNLKHKYVKPKNKSNLEK